MSIFDTIWVLRKDVASHRNDRVIGTWLVESSSAVDQLQPGAGTAFSNYGFALVACGDKVGCCYTEAKLSVPGDWVGVHPNEVSSPSTEWQVALADALLPLATRTPASGLRITGTPFFKRDVRAALLADIVRECMPGSHIRAQGTVLNVGAAGAVLLELVRRGFSVKATDLDPRIIGRRLGDLVVQDGTTGVDLSGVSVVLISASSLCNGTLDVFLPIACEAGAAVILYGQTGHSLVEVLDFGVTAMVSERFPPYVFPGESYIEVYRR